MPALCSTQSCGDLAASASDAEQEALPLVHESRLELERNAEVASAVLRPIRDAIVAGGGSEPVVTQAAFSPWLIQKAIEAFGDDATLLH